VTEREETGRWTESLLFVDRVVDGFLSRGVKAYDATSGEVVTRGHSYEDLGDYLAQLLLSGDSARVGRELDLAIAYLRHRRHICLRHAGRWQTGIARGYDQSDLAFGLLLAAQWRGKYLADAGEVLEAWWQYFFSVRPRPAVLGAVPILGVPIPPRAAPGLAALSGMDHGALVELYCLYSELARDDVSRQRAVEILEALLRTSEYRDRRFFPIMECAGSVCGLLSVFMPKLQARRHHFRLLKENSNTMFGVLRLLKSSEGVANRQYFAGIVRETVHAWFTSYLNRDSWVFHTEWDHKTNKKGADLTVFHLLDLLVDAHRELGEETYIDFACRIASSFLEHQSPHTGLIPFLHPAASHEIRRINAAPRSSWLDSLVDFGVSLCRLSEVTGRTEFQQAARRLAEGIDSYHRTKHGFASAVDVDDGRILGPRYSLKMTALVAKLYVALVRIGSITDPDGPNYYLLQDR
jgi:hypothetical protein